jgi:hypothetical protein
MADFLLEPGPLQAEAGIGYVGPQFVQSAQDNLTASTTHSIAGATPIPATYSRFTTVANAGDAAKLPAGFRGMSIGVVNAGANNMQVYAFQAGDTINGIVGSTGVSQMTGSMVFYTCFSVNPTTGVATWFAQDLGVGTTGNFPTLAYQSGMVAGTTQTAAGGTPITSSIAEFDTVAHTDDAATLPAAQPGMQIAVINNGVQTLRVFALTQALGGISGGDKINAVNTSLDMAGPPTITLFYCTVLGQWITK